MAASVVRISRSIARTAGLASIFTLTACGAVPSATETTSGVGAGSPATPPPASAYATASECRGREVDWSALPPVPAAYGRAWNEDDAAARMDLLEVAWAANGSYADPTTDGRITGREEFSRHLGEFRAGWAGTYFEPTAWVASDQHHGYVQMRWRLCGADDKNLFDGVDFGELAADGRLARSTGFFAMDGESARPVCAPPLGDWSGVPDIARDWAASATSDAAVRDGIIKRIWGEDGFYVDPSDRERVVGHAAIAERVSSMLWAGAFFEAAAWAPSDEHHGYMRLRWRLCDGSQPGLEGTDYVALNESGRFDRVIGFFPWP